MKQLYALKKVFLLVLLVSLVTPSVTTFAYGGGGGGGGGGSVYSHSACMNTVCTLVIGTGTSECTTNADCSTGNGNANGVVSNTNTNGTAGNVNQNLNQNTNLNANATECWEGGDCPLTEYANGNPSIPYEERVGGGVFSPRGIFNLISKFIDESILQKIVWVDDVPLVVAANKNEYMTRGELVRILVRWEHGNVTKIPVKNPFPDIPTTSYYAPYLCLAKTEGWIHGYPNGNFIAENNVNRVEALKMVLHSQFKDEDIKGGTMDFKDTNKGAWYERFVAFAALKKLVTGYLDKYGYPIGYFGPAKILLRSEIASMLYYIKTR